MIIGLIFIFAGVLFLIETIRYTRKKNKLEDVKFIDKSNIKKEKKKLSNLWEINGIDNQVITCNNNQHSIIVELESIEYGLLHNEEKQSVDRELISIAKMLKFPIQFLEIKKQIELGEMMDEILANTLNANENLKKYGNEIIKHLEKLEENKDLFERKNYIIISSFNNKSIAEVELKEFYQLLRYHLLNIKVNARILNNDEIVELIYEQLHKENKNKILELVKEGGLELYVTGKKRKENQAV